MAKTVFEETGRVLTAAVMNGLQEHDHKGEDRDGSCPKLALTDLSDDLLDYIRFGNAFIGELKPYAGGNVPYGWLGCDGAAVPADPLYDSFRAWIDGYASYLKKAGVYYTPNMAGRAFIGTGSITEENFEHSFPLGYSDGEVMHLLLESEMPHHRHEHSFHTRAMLDNDSSEWSVFGRDHQGQDGDSSTYTEYTGGGEKHPNMPPYFVGTWLIRVI